MSMEKEGNLRTTSSSSTTASKKRSLEDPSGLGGPGGHEDSGAVQFNTDYYIPSRDEDLHLSEPGKRDEPSTTGCSVGGGSTTGATEESFCSNFVCCGVHLADLHALLQHYEDIHVKVQNGDEDADNNNNQNQQEEDLEAQDVDVTGDGFSQSARQQTIPGRSSLPTGVGAPGNGERMRRTDSVLSTHSFGSTAAADALLGVATNYVPYPRPRTEPTFEGQPFPPGYYYGGGVGVGGVGGPAGSVPTAPHYYAPPPPPARTPNGEQPVSAFDNTILRTVSPAQQQASGYSPYYAGGGYPMMYAMPPGSIPPGGHPYYHHGYGMPIPMPYQGPGAPHHYQPPYPHQQQQQQQHMQQHMQPFDGNKPKRPRSASSIPNMKAVQAASSTLRESLPAALGSEQDPNQFKLIYSILSNTMTPSPHMHHPGDESGTGNKEPSAIDKATAAKNAAALILAMPRPPVDKSLERPYICPVPGCGKAYKNPNGLKYHALHGHDGTQELVERPYKCPYGDCGKRYKNPNGLKYHLNKNHAEQMPKTAGGETSPTAADETEGDSDAHDHSEPEEDA